MRERKKRYDWRTVQRQSEGGPVTLALKLAVWRRRKEKLTLATHITNPVKTLRAVTELRHLVPTSKALTIQREAMVGSE